MILLLGAAWAGAPVARFRGERKAGSVLSAPPYGDAFGFPSSAPPKLVVSITVTALFSFFLSLPAALEPSLFSSR